jgi:hypothetical protein
MLFDEPTRKAGPLVSHALAWTPIVEGYRWSDDSSVETDRGWITRAPSILELAGKIGRDAHAVEAAVVRYNAFACSRQDADFGPRPVANAAARGAAVLRRRARRRTRLHSRRR